jgi:hypothetical protein
MGDLVKDKELPSIEIKDINKESIRHWVLINTDDDGEIKEFKITITDPVKNEQTCLSYDEFKEYPHIAPEYVNYDWDRLTNDIEHMKRLAIEHGKRKKEGNKKKTYNAAVYRKVYCYLINSLDKGIVLEKITIDRDKKTKQPIKRTERTLETFYEVRLPFETGKKLWIFNDVLDDLLDRGINNIRIYVNENTFLVDSKVFLTYGSLREEKVYIDIDSSPFIVYKVRDNIFDVDAPVTK